MKKPCSHSKEDFSRERKPLMAGLRTHLSAFITWINNIGQLFINLHDFAVQREGKHSVVLASQQNLDTFI